MRKCTGMLRQSLVKKYKDEIALIRNIGISEGLDGTFGGAVCS